MFQIPPKAKYRVQPAVLMQRQWDPPFANHNEGGVRCPRCTNGTLIWKAASGRYKGREVSNGPNPVKQYTKRKKQGHGPRMKAYWGNVLR